MENDYNYLDLFSGIGGFALGAYWADMKFKNHYASEIDQYCIELYQKRFPDSIQLGDIKKIDSNKLPAVKWIISGGFPCQDISVAGKGAGIEGKRSGLWFTYADIISRLRPRFAIMENVGALTIRGLDAVLGSLAEIGYNAEWQDIRAEDMGAPHKRERIWIVAYPGCELREQGDTAGMETGQAKRSTSELHNQSSSKGQRENYWTIEPPVGRLVDGLPSRVDRLKGLGNAIIPQIAEMLFRLIKPHL